MSQKRYPIKDTFSYPKEDTMTDAPSTNSFKSLNSTNPNPAPAQNVNVTPNKVGGIRGEVTRKEAGAKVDRSKNQLENYDAAFQAALEAELYPNGRPGPIEKKTDESKQNKVKLELPNPASNKKESLLENEMPKNKLAETKTEETKPAQAMHKVKVNGVEKEVTTEELVKNYQIQEAAQKSLEKQRLKEKETESKLAALEAAMAELNKNPFEYAQQVAAKNNPQAVEEWAQQQVMKKIQEDLMKTNPDYAKSIEFENMKKELEARRNAENTAKQQAEAEQLKKMEEDYANQFLKDTLDVLMEENLMDKDYKVAENNKQTNLLITNQIAYYIQQGLNQGLKLTPKDVIGQVKQDYSNYINTFLVNLPLDQLEGNLSPEFLDKVRQLNLSKLKTPSNPIARKNVVKQVKKQSARQNVNLQRDPMTNRQNALQAWKKNIADGKIPNINDQG